LIPLRQFSLCPANRPTAFAYALNFDGWSASDQWFGDEEDGGYTGTTADEWDEDFPYVGDGRVSEAEAVCRTKGEEVCEWGWEGE